MNPNCNYTTTGGCNCGQSQNTCPSAPSCPPPAPAPCPPPSPNPFLRHITPKVKIFPQDHPDPGFQFRLCQLSLHIHVTDQPLLFGQQHGPAPQRLAKMGISQGNCQLLLPVTPRVPQYPPGIFPP